MCTANDFLFGPSLSSFRILTTLFPQFLLDVIRLPLKQRPVMLLKGSFSEGRQATYSVYIRKAVIVSANFIEGKNHTKPSHRWLLLYPIIRVFTPQKLCFCTFSTGYSGRIHHSILLLGSCNGCRMWSSTSI